MLNEWIKQTHGTTQNMFENERKFLEQEAFYDQKIEEIRNEQIRLMTERSAISLSEHLGYKKPDMKSSKEGQVSYFKNYDFSREKSLRSFRFEDGIEMGDLGSVDV